MGDRGGNKRITTRPAEPLDFIHPVGLAMAGADDAGLKALLENFGAALQLTGLMEKLVRKLHKLYRLAPSYPLNKPVSRL